MQERRNFIAKALEFRPSSTNPSIYCTPLKTACDSILLWLGNGWFYPYPPGLLTCIGAVILPPVPVMQPWGIWVNSSHQSSKNDDTTTTKQNTTKLSTYFMGCIELLIGLIPWFHHKCQCSKHACCQETPQNLGTDLLAAITYLIVMKRYIPSCFLVHVYLHFCMTRHLGNVSM